MRYQFPKFDPWEDLTTNGAERYIYSPPPREEARSGLYTYDINQ